MAASAVGRFTHLGDFAALATLTLLTAMLLLRARAYGLAVAWLCAMIGAGVLTNILKSVFERARPLMAEPFPGLVGSSFPSGHAVATTAAASMLVYISFRTRSAASWRWLAVTSAIGWTLTMGFSRVYLGVHHFSDVVAGFAAGAGWAIACIAGLETTRAANALRGT